MVRQKYGITPAQIVDFKAIAGDASDAIPGVPGIGEVGATKLIAEFGSFDAIFANLEKVPETLRKKLLTGKESAEMSFELAKIDCAVPLDFSLDKCGWSRDATDVDRILAFVEKYEFHRLKNRIEKFFGPDLKNDPDIRTAADFAKPIPPRSSRRKKTSDD